MPDDDGGFLVPAEFAGAIIEFALIGDVMFGEPIDLTEFFIDPQPDAIVETDKP